MWTNPSNFVVTTDRSVSSRWTGSAARNRRCFSRIILRRRLEISIIRYAGRNRVEDGLGISVNFFHLDCLASEVRLNVDLDATLTVLANGCYRWLGKQLRGYEKAAPKQLYRLFVATQGFIKVTPDELIVRFEKTQSQPDPARGRIGSRADLQFPGSAADESGLHSISERITVQN